MPSQNRLALEHMLEYEEEPSEEFRSSVTALPVDLVTFEENDECTLLQLACLVHEKKEHVRVLLQHGVNPTAEPKSSGSDLSWLAGVPPDMFDVLAEFMQPGELDLCRLARTLVRVNVEEDSVAKLKTLLDTTEKTEEMNRASKFIWVRITRWTTETFSLLQYAARQGLAEHLQLLLDFGLDPAAVSEEQKKTSIQLAAECKLGQHMEVFSILAPLMEGTEGLKKAEEALNLAKIGAMFDLMRGASMSNQEVEDFKSSLEKLPVEQVTSALVEGISYPSDTSVHMTLLQNCAYEGKTEIAKWLLEYGVEANFAPPEGENCNTALESPLFIAVRRFPSNTDLISALLQHGANPTEPSRQKGRSAEFQLSPLEKACDPSNGSSIEVLDLLTKHAEKDSKLLDLATNAINQIKLNS